MKDRIEKLGNSLIHHGKNSNRIYLMKLNEQDLPHIAFSMEELAIRNGYTKIIAKIPEKWDYIFEETGYKKEAFIPRMYQGKENGNFWCHYLEERRKVDVQGNTQEIIDIANKRAVQNADVEELVGLECRQAVTRDIPDMVSLYKQVFQTYPFPIFEKKYIEDTMQSNLIYFGVWDCKKLVGLSSIEMDQNNNNAEMTDFAVIPEYRGKKISLNLLRKMEQKFDELGIKTAFTIARAKSSGMNITFAQNGYQYSGTLWNNTDIDGTIENMNVWYKIYKS